MDLETTIGFDSSPQHKDLTKDPFLVEYANLKLASLGQPTVGEHKEFKYIRLAGGLLGEYREQVRQLGDHRSPVDQRIQDFVERYLADLPKDEPLPKLPARTLTLDRHGLARTLSLPPHNDHYKSEIIQSYRLENGVLHNPANDRRTTKGVFHVCEGGLPIADDKIIIPKITFSRLLCAALKPPHKLMRLPFSYGQEKEAEVWASLLMRPIVCPSVGGTIGQKSYEVRFFAPGNLISNLDFVESIFGNAGDPFLPENDAAIDIKHWTGHSGCVILAPHLIGLTKKELGLPHIKDATERQKRDGTCWEKEDELYNNGTAFKATARDASGVIVTVIADNYFGYCKKEVKTQISFSANLYGLAEEEHAGGAIAFPSYDLGEDFRINRYENPDDHSFGESMKHLGERVEIKPEGYALDRTFESIVYLHETAHITLHDQRINWQYEGAEQSMRLCPDTTYVYPSGYKVEMLRPATEGRRWRLIGTVAEGVFCHKPCTVSGGGKSEISKSISDAIIYAPVIVANFKKDFDMVQAIIEKDYGQRYRDVAQHTTDSRPILSKRRTLGSVVKLLTPAPEFTDEYNQWLNNIPYYIKEMVFIVKRHYKEDWENHWRERFSVDSVNGADGNWLKYKEQRLVTQYLRVGYNEDGSWRIHGLRKDFHPAAKLQTEDDISASIVMPLSAAQGLSDRFDNLSIKFIENCEYRLFQRPDDAIVRGYDKKTESDVSKPGNFLSNYEPLTKAQATEIAEDVIRFEQYTKPMRDAIESFIANPDSPDYISITTHPRIVDGKPTKNPRYLQDRDDLLNPRSYYLGQIGARLFRNIPDSQEIVPMPVNAVLPGRRNNPPEGSIRSLAVFNPIHYLPLPEFFMEVISSMTGKSPSTTGAGSEGALTKGPFNALQPIVDLNNALVSFVLTGYNPFITAAGYVGPKHRVDHDVSLLVPEVWSRMKPEEWNPQFLIENDMLEKVPDIEFNGQTIKSSILGYRITDRFVRQYFGRVFANPAVVFSEDTLKPELQSLEIFADGMANILETHERVAQNYFNDGSIDGACPPLRALLHIMRDGHYEGNTIDAPQIRELFTREALLQSDWYQARLKARQDVEIALWERHVEYLKARIDDKKHLDVPELDLEGRLQHAEETLTIFRKKERPQALVGTIGTDPFLHR